MKKKFMSYDKTTGRVVTYKSENQFRNALWSMLYDTYYRDFTIVTEGYEGTDYNELHNLADRMAEIDLHAVLSGHIVEYGDIQYYSEDCDSLAKHTEILKFLFYVRRQPLTTSNSFIEETLDKLIEVVAHSPETRDFQSLRRFINTVSNYNYIYSELYEYDVYDFEEVEPYIIKYLDLNLVSTSNILDDADCTLYTIEDIRSKYFMYACSLFGKMLADIYKEYEGPK